MTLDAALTDHSDAELLILMGDLCHHVEPVAYQRVARSLSKVSMPVIQMMGNHDRREAFLASFPNVLMLRSMPILQVLLYLRLFMKP